MSRRLGRQAIGRVLYAGATIAAKYPALALPVARWTGHGVVVDERTDVVIEGYPRSANGFAVAAFCVAQRGPVRVAHHTHAPSQVIAAARRELPVLVLARHPQDAVVEWIAVKPMLSVGQGLRAYVRFYEPLLPYRDRFVVGTFDRVNADFGSVIRSLNARFGTSFREFEHADDNVREAGVAAARDRKGRTGPGLPVIGRTTSIGSDDDEAIRERLRQAYSEPALAELRARAQGLFRMMESS